MMQKSDAQMAPSNKEGHSNGGSNKNTDNGHGGRHDVNEARHASASPVSQNHRSTGRLRDEGDAPVSSGGGDDSEDGRGRGRGDAFPASPGSFNKRNSVAEGQERERSLANKEEVVRKPLWEPEGDDWRLAFAEGNGATVSLGVSDCELIFLFVPATYRVL